jgi:hypothetical protein
MANLLQGHLDWVTFADSIDNHQAIGNGENQFSALTLQEFTNAQILIAADVLYDVNVIDSLVMVVKRFLSVTTATTTTTTTSEKPSERLVVQKEKLVILAVTRRNVTTFGLFLDVMEQHGIGYRYLATNCAEWPPIFGCNFPQGRGDVQIIQLTYQ